MRDTDRGMDFMRVRPPSAPPPNLRRADVTPTRLARNVALLFGVDIPANPVGATWVSDYSRLTVAEVGRGAPLPARGQEVAVPSGRWALVGRAVVKGGAATTSFDPSWREIDGCDEIAAATLNRFGPDTKAALVLTGVNELFSSLEQVFRDVIEVIGVSEDGEPLADFMRIATWAVLITEVYRNQSAVFSAAVTARAVQRATALGWRPHVPVEFEKDVARTEFRPERVDRQDPAATPTTVRIFDEMMSGVVRPILADRSEATGAEGSGSNNDYLLEDLIDRWCRYLTRSSDQGMSWVVDAGDGRRRVETYVPTLAPLSSFMHDVIALNSQVHPYGSPPSSGRIAFDITSPAHRRRVRPRIPSLAEMRRLDLPSQQAVIFTIIQLHRLLANMHEFKSSNPDLFAEIWGELSEDREALRVLSDALLGSSHPLTVRAAQMVARAQAEFLRDHDPAGADVHWDDMVEAFTTYRRLMENGEVPPGVWIDTLVTSSPALDTRISDLRANKRETEAEMLRDQLVSDWDCALRILGVDVKSAFDALNADGALPDHFYLLPGALHNYLGLMLKSTNPAELREYIEYGTRVVLPVRKKIAALRKSDLAPRLTIQVLLRGIDRALARTEDDEDRRWLIKRCQELLAQYVGTTLVSHIVYKGEKPPNESPSSVLNVLIALVSSALTLYEAGVNPIVDLPTIGRIMALADDLAKPEAHNNGAVRMSDRQQVLKRLRDRFRAVSEVVTR